MIGFTSAIFESSSQSDPISDKYQSSSNSHDFLGEGARAGVEISFSTALSAPKQRGSIVIYPISRFL
jgi:hypothetical protein